LTETKSTTLSDTSLEKVHSIQESENSFPSASSYNVGEIFDSPGNKTAMKMAEITIHVYQVQGQSDMGYSMTVTRSDIFDGDKDTAKILSKIADNCEKRYRNRKSRS
jgi:hypothetical protein